MKQGFWLGLFDMEVCNVMILTKCFQFMNPNSCIQLKILSMHTILLDHGNQRTKHLGS